MNTTKPTLYIFVGYPGAGKTTAAHIIEAASGAVHLWADHERQAMFDNVTHSKDESRQLYGALNERAAKLLAGGQSVIFDTNFNYRSDRDHMARLAAEAGARLQIIWLETPLELARERAMHEHHRDRNGYDHQMSADTFAQLTDHLEAPAKNEKFIKIDGQNIDKTQLLAQLGL